MKKFLAATAMAAAAITLVPTAASAHGHGGDSGACSDKEVPGEGVETPTPGLGPVNIGAQGGSETAVDHIAYADVCARFGGPTVSLPLIGDAGVRYGSYSSVRVHTDTANCAELVQLIFNVDNDSTVQPPEYNTCRFG